LIKNRTTLERKHGREGKILLGAIEAAIKSVEPGLLVKHAVKASKKAVTFSDIYGKSLTIEGFSGVYVLGAGKATAAMAGAICRILKDKVKGGAITVPRGIRMPMIDRAISVTHASHPVPDRHGVDGARKIISILEKANENELAIVLISGGGSALLPLPAKGISLSDKQRVTKELLASGASIHEINAVRKHLSAVKGGQLATYTRCKIVSLILSDVVADDLAVIASGPTFPDPTTYSDALEIIRKYKIRNAKVTKHLTKGSEGQIKETPKPGDALFGRVSNILIGNNQVACDGAARYLAKKVPTVENMGSEFDGEAQVFGKFIAKVASNRRSGPFAIVAGGETTVTLGNAAGKGGRNQEAALAYAMAFKRSMDMAAAFIGTDGVDGNSNAAGAIVSQRSIETALKIKAKRYLREHDSYHALKEMGSLIFTGYTGTNVNDLAIVLRIINS
jgi:glycerate 2-kinase